jgi:malate synthase
VSGFPSAEGVEVTGATRVRYDEVLTEQSLEFVAGLERRFRSRRDDLLHLRAERQHALDRGEPLEFLEETREVREADWSVAPPAVGLVDRRCEITGPTDRRMAINALNSGARVWMADFEDANSPTFDNLVQGQLNLQDVIDDQIDFETPEGRRYELAPDHATVVVRPRGWHLWEKHLLVDEVPVTAAFFDFGIHAFHTLTRRRESEARPYYYLPKLESHLEARLWNDVFEHTEGELGAPSGAIRATVLIETIPAAFEMQEILFELREHAAGLNAGRWDYLFSIIKKFRNRGERFVLPDRNEVTMAAPFMRDYTELLVATCHRRGAHAIGGMAAFIPSRRDPQVNARALDRVKEDKEREARAGFDGSWVAHPDLVGVCTAAFDGAFKGALNQLSRQREDVAVGAAQLLDVAATPGSATEAGLRNDVSVGLQYLAAWLRGQGAVAVFNLMEDVATAEIARSQIWQWRRNALELSSGEVVTDELVRRVLEEELHKLQVEGGVAFDAEAYRRAKLLFEEVALGEEFPEFLTLLAYDELE